MHNLINITGNTIITGVIGNNTKYSLSPKIHNYWYKQHNIDGVYVAFGGEDAHFDTIIEGLFCAGIRGVNVTVPFKYRAFEFADILTPQAEAAEAVNILYPDADGIIIGHNSDGFGLISAIKHCKKDFDFQTAKILMIGAGGAASGILSALLEESAGHIDIINRTFDKAQHLADLYEDIEVGDIRAIADYTHSQDTYDLILQTTSLDAVIAGGVNDVPADLLSKDTIVMDINYGPKKGVFLKNIMQYGCHIKDGLPMLVEQARPSFMLFNQLPKMPIADEALYKIL